MPRDITCRLITKDFHILQAMLAERSERDDPLVPLLREKLATAKLLLPHEVSPDVVTLYSRVRYRVGAEAATSRIVIQGTAHEVLGATLPVTHPRGLALLGLAEQQTFTLRDAQGRPEAIHVEKVLYQPQAAGRRPEVQGLAIRRARDGVSS